MPTDVVEETRAAREHSGAKRVEVEKVMVDKEGNPIVDQEGQGVGVVHLQRRDKQ